MNSLEDYFTKNETEFFQNVVILKRIAESDSELDTEIEIDLSRKNLQISYEWGDRVTDPKELFTGFMPIPKEHLHSSALRNLEGKFVLLEWFNTTWNALYRDCSEITVVKILNKGSIKVLNLITPEKEDNLYATNSYHRPTIIFSEGPSDVVITMDKLTQIQHYEKNGHKWSVQWKIWIPSECYNTLFGFSNKN